MTAKLSVTRIAFIAVVAGSALAVGLWGNGPAHTPTADAAPPPTELIVGLDFGAGVTDPGTYDINNLPSFEACVDVNTSVNSGKFYIDLLVLNASGLIGFNADLEFSSGMQIVSSNVNKLFGTDGGVINLSQATPDPDGMWEAAAIDIGVPNSGSGVLVRIEAQAFIPPSGGRVLDFGIETGLSKGVTLTDNTTPPAPNHPGDTTGDGIFDGTIINPAGTVAVNRADSDGDTVSDDCDNCDSTPNAGQADNDSDGVGDVCDPDDDNDGICDVGGPEPPPTPGTLGGCSVGPSGSDNCPTVPNPGQEDLNSNGLGDACEDTDGDGILDGLDNCPSISNSGQADNDNDDVGDPCDDDDDNDGICDVGGPVPNGTPGTPPGGCAVGPSGSDNCPVDANSGQEDWNSDGIGDACQNSDGDAWIDAEDNCPGIGNNGQEDGDGDGVGNVCDNCPSTPNPDQSDLNVNGVGDACEDSDGDGYCDACELFIGTLPTAACAATPDTDDEDPDSMPTDMSDDQWTTLTDVLRFIPVFNSVSPDPRYKPRFDLNTDGFVTLSDVLKFIPVFNTNCAVP